jgi:hypothetical protein
MTFEILPPVVKVGFISSEPTVIGALNTTGASQLTEISAGTWAGHGAPPSTIAGSKTGDEYIDLDSGNVYTLS